MGKSMKDALEKAGFVTSRKENEIPKVAKQEKKKIHEFQSTRNFCECCQMTMPDVEYYKHKNPLLDARWICIQCADKNMILDDLRETNQSDYSRKNIFRRFYGPTKHFTGTVTEPGKISYSSKDGRSPNKKY